MKSWVIASADHPKLSASLDLIWPYGNRSIFTIQTNVFRRVTRVSPYDRDCLTDTHISWKINVFFHSIDYLELHTLHRVPQIVVHFSVVVLIIEIPCSLSYWSSGNEMDCMRPNNKKCRVVSLLINERRNLSVDFRYLSKRIISISHYVMSIITILSDWIGK